MVYFLVIVFCFILSVLADMFKKSGSKPLFYVFSIVCIATLSILAGCRDLNVGYDVLYYAYDYFNMAKYSDTYLEYINNVKSDLVYLFVNYVSSLLSDSFHFALGVISFVTFSFYYFACSRLSKVVYFPLLFICILLYQYMVSMNILRQTLAAGIVFYAFTFIDESRRFGGGRFLLLSVLALLSHITAILPIVFLLYANYTRNLPEAKQNKKLVFVSICCILMVIGLAVLLNIVSSIRGLEHYATYAISSGNETWRTPIFPKAAFLFTSICLFIVYISYKRKQIEKSMFSYFFIIITFSLSVSFLCRYTGSMQRLLYYSMPIMMVLIIKVINDIRMTKMTNILSHLCLCAYFIAYFVFFFDNTLYYHSTILGI